MGYEEDAYATFVIKDAWQQGAKMRFRVPAATLVTSVPLANIRNALADVTNGAIEDVYVHQGLHDPALDAAAAPTGSLENAEDKAKMIFQDTFGRPVEFNFPIPEEDVWLEDLETLDEEEGDVATLITTIIALVISSAANALIEYVRGYRWRAKTRSKKPGTRIQVV